MVYLLINGAGEGVEIDSAGADDQQVAQCEQATLHQIEASLLFLGGGERALPHPGSSRSQEYFEPGLRRNRDGAEVQSAS